MTAPPGGRRALGYQPARRLLGIAGLVVLLLTALMMFVRRVDTVEVIAVLLFVPVFLSFLLWDAVGGAIAGVLASLTYGMLRLDAIDQVGLEHFRGHLLSRWVAYLAFGVLGGLANSQLAGSLQKLEIYDQVDDLTGLHNARFLLQDADLETARANRYKTIFSIVSLDVPATVFDGLGRRQRAAVLTGLGRLLADSVRTVDRVAHGFDGELHRFAVVLPETASEGARVFADRFATWMRDYLAQKGGKGAAVVALNAKTMSYPEDEVAMRRLREEFAEIDRGEHPVVPAPA